MAASTNSVASTDGPLVQPPHGGPAGARRGGWLALASLVPLLILLALLAAYGFSPKSQGQVQRTGSVTWLGDFTSAVALSRHEGKLLHVHFTQPDVPLAATMDQTLQALPVAQLAGAHFVNLRLDARKNAELFKRSIGSAGRLASCVLDARDAAAAPDVVAVAPGSVPADRYVEWLSLVAGSAKRLRQLRNAESASGAERVELADLYAAQGSADRARQVLAGVTWEAKERCQALERLARLDVEAGQTSRARDELERSHSCPPGSPDVVARSTLTEAMLLSSERQVSAAVSLLLARVPGLARGAERDHASLLLAQLQHELARDSDALKTLAALRASAATPTWARAAEEQTTHILNPTPGHVH